MGSTRDLKGLEIGEKGAKGYLDEAPPILKLEVKESMEVANKKKRVLEYYLSFILLLLTWREGCVQRTCIYGERAFMEGK